MTAIRVTNLGKAYKQYPSRWARFAEWLVPFGRKRHTLKWVLHDIDFSVDPGGAVGIIGINGAGKSTLLKLITGTTRPTTGTVEMAGKVAALLELGMGFHPDFTGRQNVFMSGQLLGMTTAELQDLMPQIESFADIGEYIDEQVRVYSSGMQMRLAFSIATARRPDVLIIDEALSVGDDHFQHKSFQRIREFNEQGTTLLIVSHDKAAIQAICNNAILLSGGKVAMQGAPEAVMDYYNALISDREGETVKQVEPEAGSLKTSSGTGEATVSDLSLLNANGETVSLAKVGEPLKLVFEIDINESIADLTIGYQIKDRLGQVIFGTNSDLMNVPLQRLQKGEKLTASYEFDCRLGDGSYSISVALHSGRTHVAANYSWIDQAIVFEVRNFADVGFIGSNWMPPQLDIYRPEVVGIIATNMKVNL